MNTYVYFPLWPIAKFGSFLMHIWLPLWLLTKLGEEKKNPGCGCIHPVLNTFLPIDDAYALEQYTNEMEVWVCFDHIDIYMDTTSGFVLDMVTTQHA